MYKRTLKRRIIQSRHKKVHDRLNDRIDVLNRVIHRLKETLRHSVVLNRAVFDHSPVGISVRSSTGRLLFVNKAWKKIWRLSNRQIRENEKKCEHWSLKRRYPYLKDMAPRVKQIFESGGELFLPELKVSVSRTGAVHWISQYYYAIQDKHKEVEQVVILTQDITEHKAAEMALREIGMRFRTIVENVSVGVYRTTGDPEGRFIEANPALVKMFGHKSLKELLKIRVSDLYHNRKDRRGFIKELMRKKFVRNREILMKKKDQTLIWVSVYAKAQFNDRGRVQWIDGVIDDITERKRKEDQLRTLTLVDDLTGLYNRRGFLTLAEHQLKIAHEKKKSLVLLYADLDNLKKINDLFGHSIGDRALIEATNIFRKTFRESDIIARIGGDEFVVLTSEINTARAQSFRNRLLKNFDLFNKKGKLPCFLELSIGWACYNPDSPQTIHGLLSTGDRSMYRHKHGKKKLKPHPRVGF